MTKRPSLYAPGADLSPELDFTEFPYSAMRESGLPRPAGINFSGDALIDDIENTPLEIEPHIFGESMRKNGDARGIGIKNNEWQRTIKMGLIEASEEKGGRLKEVCRIAAANDNMDKDAKAVKKIKEFSNIIGNCNFSMINPRITTTSNDELWRTGAFKIKTTSNLPKRYKTPEDTEEGYM
ncbi:MAG: hypothetical protein JXA43_02580 [Candidatus Diapherotrites archaeon]|nr:hypothetical protein [Candidatus Diapherotrites archaeon]